jgi:Acyl-CoA thioesterase C-terminal domain/Acyl-CoA thioesterase N-terminal domain
VADGADSEDSIFTRLDEDLYQPSEHARGPWDRGALHGGAAAGLIAGVLERLQPGAELATTQLRFEFLRPIPLGPLQLRTGIIRPGRRVQELQALLSAGDELICRASAVRAQPIPDGLPPAEADPGLRRLPGPEQGTRKVFALNEDDRGPSFATTGMEMSWLTDPYQLGPGRVWMRLRLPLLDGARASSLAQLTATADFNNGIGAELPFGRFLFINADLTIQLWTRPRGEWAGLDARTLLYPGAAGSTESVLHDEHGPVGRAFQSLVVQPR